MSIIGLTTAELSPTRAGNERYCEIGVVPIEQSNDMTLSHEFTTLANQLNLSPVLRELLLGVDIELSPATYLDIIQDVLEISQSRAIDRTTRYFSISSISSCYRKHTQDSAVQALPHFKVSFTYTKDKGISIGHLVNDHHLSTVAHAHLLTNVTTNFCCSNLLGTCYFSSTQTRNEAQNVCRWLLDKQNLKIVDQRGVVLLYSPVTDLLNPSFSFDYCAPSKFIDLKLDVVTEDKYFNFKAHIKFENASIDANNPVEVIVDLDAPKTIRLPLFLSPNSIAKMRARVVVGTEKDKGSLQKQEEISAIIENFGEGSVSLADTSIIPLHRQVGPVNILCYIISFNDLFPISPHHHDIICFFKDTSLGMSIAIEPPYSSKRSIQILIHGATFTDALMEVCSTPSLYCVVYALDKKGNKLTPKNSAFSTSVFSLKVGEFSPLWNEQFDLSSSDLIQQFEVVKIKIKLHKSGFLRDRNLGVVQISPKVIFKDYTTRTETVLIREFTIPIEKCSNGLSAGLGTKSLGSVKLTIRIQGTDSTKAELVTPAVIIGSYGTLKMNYSFHHPDELSTWWPCFDLHASSSLSSTTKRQSRFLSVDAGHLAAPMAIVGNINFSQTCVQVRLCPAWRTNAEESTSADTLIITLPWDLVIEVEVLTDTVVSVVLSLSPTLVASIGKSLTIEHMNGHDSVELVVAPCPAYLLKDMSLERRTLQVIRTELVTFADAVIVSSAAEQETSSSVDQPKQDLLLLARHIFNGLLFEETHAKSARCRAYLVCLLQMTGRLFKTGLLPVQDESYVLQLLDNDTDEVTQRLELIQAADAVTAAEAAEKLGINAVALRSVHVPSIIEACKYLVDAAEARVVDIILAIDVLSPISVKASSASSSFNGSLPGSPSSSSSSGTSLCALVSHTINGYLSAMREILTAYLGTEDKFNQISGQEFKMLLLKFFIYEDKILADMLTPYLDVIRCECWPLPVLLPGAKFNTSQIQYHQMMRNSLVSSPMAVRQYKEHLSKLAKMVCLNDLLEWYGRDLVLETQKWLAKTLRNAWTTKQNAFNLPWDFTVIDLKYVSCLPETLRFQLNVYLDLCVVQTEGGTAVDSNIDAPASPSASAIAGVITISPEVASRTYSGSQLKESRLLRVNSLIVKAIARCFLLLAEEFKRALQSKHWADGTSLDERSQNGNFLVSLINDSFRTCTVHLDPLMDIKVSDSSSSELSTLVRSVTSTFNYVAERSVAILVSVIFTDLEEVLVNFDSLWGKSSQNVTNMISTTLQEYFRDIAVIMESHYYKSVILYSAKSTVLRYLLFLHDRSSVSKLTEEEAMLLQTDISTLKSCFVNALEHPSGQLLALFVYLEDMCSLIRLEFSQPTVQSLLQAIVDRYRGEGREIARLVVDCCLKLRPVCSSYHKSVVDGILGSTSSLSKAASPQDLDTDLFRKVFLPEWSKVPSSVIVKDSKEKNDAMYANTTLKHAHTPMSNPFRYVAESAHRRFWNVKDKEKSHLVALRRALDLEFGHTSGTGEKGDTAADEYDERGDENGDDGDEHEGMTLDSITIEIFSIQVKGLVSASFFSKPNPYCVFQCSGSGKRQKTSVLSGKTDASWDSVLTFQLDRTQFFTGKYDKLNVWIFDKEILRRKNLLGSVCVSLAGINVHDIDSWFALEGSTTSEKGKIHLSIRFIDEKAKSN